MGLLDRLRQLRNAVPQDDIAGRTQALVVHGNEFGYDAFGMSRDSVRTAAAVARWLYRHYFRAEAHGIENIPTTGRLILVANHSGQLPFDGLVIGSACFLEPPQPRLVRAMVEFFVPTVPFASYLFSRWGQITGTPENCRRLLSAEEAVLVFPEGARGISKPFSKRYQLEEFGKGFMRLALETGAPIIPVAVVGAEEQAPAVNLKGVARLLGMPALPVVPYPPFVPLLPLPVKYRLYFGEAMHFTGDPDDDDDALAEKARAVKHRIQSMI
ncbi:MAG TPA: lysophospholipid acyltransferase family protein, partial [Kofleriaceae bacterium]|nr:lysophospholipid acyltransferase family protein [Kofleriaceae bacterium]